MSDDIHISDELRTTLNAAIAESERLGPSVIPPDAGWSYTAVTGQAGIACRTKDTAGRRVTCFISLSSSVGRNSVEDAVMIAEALQARRDHEAARIRAYRMARVFEPSMDGYYAAMSVYTEAFGPPEGELLVILPDGSTKQAWELQSTDRITKTVDARSSGGDHPDGGDRVLTSSASEDV